MNKVLLGHLECHTSWWHRLMLCESLSFELVTGFHYKTMVCILRAVSGQNRAHTFHIRNVILPRVALPRSSHGSGAPPRARGARTPP